MDMTTYFVIKTEQPWILETNNNDALDVDVQVKVERVHIDDNDWCIQSNTADIKASEHHEYTETLFYTELKEYCYQKCMYCCKIFPNCYNLLQHNLTHLEIPLTIPNLYQCHNCLVYYTVKSKLAMHIKNKHSNNNESSKQIKTGPASKKLQQCTICKKVITYSNWHSHMSSVHGKDMFKCEKCNIVFKCKRYLSGHNLYTHSVTDLQCSQCPKAFKNRDCLNHHVKNCHSECVQCSLCNSKLKSNAYLQTHMRRVHYDDGKKHKCKICFKEFRSPRYLSIHIKNAHSNKALKSLKICEVCGRSYKTPQSFNAHAEKCSMDSLVVKKENVTYI